MTNMNNLNFYEIEEEFGAEIDESDFSLNKFSINGAIYDINSKYIPKMKVLDLYN